MKALRVCALLVLTTPVFLSAQNFSPDPLHAPIAFPTDSLPVDATAFKEWLAIQSPPALAENPQPVREHLYALIAQIVKQRFSSGQSTDLPEGDTTLASLFLWGDRLGVPGAADVARALGENNLVPSTVIPSDHFELTLTGGLFSLAAERGKWMARFPYYFMIGSLTRKELKNGIESDIAILSTLTAANSGTVGGASQATVLLLSAQTNDLPDYAAFWLQQLQIPISNTAPNPVPQATRSYRVFDPASGLWKEMVAFSIPSGSLIVAYIGLDGTYQANRPHFLDLLASLRARE